MTERHIYITNSDNIIIKSDNMTLELKVVGLLARDIEKRFTINEIAGALGQHYSFVHRVVNRLSEDGVIIKTKAGKAYLCSMDIKNEKTRALIQLNEIEKREKADMDKVLKLVLDDFVKSLEPVNKNIVSIILFGSYAKGTATEESDIDVLLISKGKLDIEKITKQIYAKYGKEISPVIMSPGEFKRQKNDVLIREIVAEHYVLYGIENFVNMVFEK